MPSFWHCRDDLLTYNRTTGTDAHVWRYDYTVGRFVINTRVDLGDLAQLAFGGPVEASGGEFYRSGSLFAKRPADVILYNRVSHYVDRFASMINGSTTRLTTWSAAPAPLGPNDEVAVADADGDSFDDLISVDTTNGLVRFLQLGGTFSFLTSVPGMEQGNLPNPSGQGVHLLRAPSSTTRNEVFAAFADGWIGSYYPATAGNGNKTYWWRGSYTGGYVYSRIGM